MGLSLHAVERPEVAAITMAASGETVTFRDLNDRSHQGAQLFHKLNIQPGETIAIWMENNAEYLSVCWAAHRAGLYFTPISSHLTAIEAAYIMEDSGAKAVICSPKIGEQAHLFLSTVEDYLQTSPHLFLLGESYPGFERWENAIDSMPAEAIPDATAGQPMVYSSGTTGKPKGVRLPLSGLPAEADLPLASRQKEQFGLSKSTVYLSPAPLYHTAPLVFCLNTLSLGGSVIIMEKFSPERLLCTIERYRVTHTQMVPTMFVRLLKLPEDVRHRYSQESLEYVIHAAAPCPVPIKEKMIDWWGPILYEYYGGSEGNGSTFINSQDWLAHKGSVGRAAWGVLHICDDEGNELPAGEQGIVYFEGGFDFQYNNAPDKTKDSRNPKHPTWSTLGDVGYLDSEGYLYLTDRKAFMIISGGVNIYPQETENLLITHEKVADVAVIGVPHPEFGEEVKAVVQPVSMVEAGAELEKELIEFCRRHLSAIKCPRSIDFEEALPRMDNGKLYKQRVKAKYWPAQSSDR